MVYILVAVLVFGICFAVDKGFTKTFRNQIQHKTGLSVRLSKRYALFGLFLTVIGILGICVGISDGPVLLWGGIIVLLMGLGLITYYMTFGIFYDADSFILTTFGKKSVVYSFSDIKEQKLYLVQGGSTLVELHMADGRAVGLQSTMEGMYLFLDHAFAAWCRQTGRNAEDCDFHDPANSIWFPMEDV